MNSKERVRASLQRKKPDRIPAAFEAVGSVTQKLLNHYGFTKYEELLEKFHIDIVGVSPQYIGPPLTPYTDQNGLTVVKSYWGYEDTIHSTAIDAYGVTTYFPLNHVQTIEDVECCNWPNPDWFDYSTIKTQIAAHPDKAIILGHEGPFQMVTFLMSMDKFFMLMCDSPQVAQRVLDKMVEFELEYYRRCFEAGEGNIDILRTHDDYGTQISLLFSPDMWREFFKKNTEKLVNLAHEYGAFFQQHSCGAVAPIIEELIACKVDSIEPLQKVEGLDAETLLEKYGGRITFHGGIDTQGLLPNGTPQEVCEEVRKYMHLLGSTNGYILMASQGFEGDVPVENIEAVYTVPRNLS